MELDRYLISCLNKVIFMQPVHACNCGKVFRKNMWRKFETVFFLFQRPARFSGSPRCIYHGLSCAAQDSDTKSCQANGRGHTELSLVLVTFPFLCSFFLSFFQWPMKQSVAKEHYSRLANKIVLPHTYNNVVYCLFFLHLF